MSFSLYLSFGYRDSPNNGKELDKMHGLNMYDYSARYMEPAIGRFTSVDPHAENYFSWSPYVYVGNNPTLRTDPVGMDWFVDNYTGNVIFIKGVQELTEDLALTYNLGEIIKYENIGGDNMFGDKVSWGEDGNLLDFAFANMDTDSEAFMNTQGYAKVEKITVKEEITIYSGSFGMQENVKHEQISEDIIRNLSSYATPDRLNTNRNIQLSQKREAFCVNSTTMINEYIVPYGQVMK